MLFTTTIGQGQDIVLLHGWGMPSIIWDDMANALAQHHRITVVDLPGYGKSAPIAALTLASMSEHLLKHLPKPAIFIGWSMGGLIAMHIAAHYPEHTRALITIASSPKFVKDSSWPHGIDYKVFERFASSLTKDYYGTMHRFIALQELDSDQPSVTVRHLRRIIQLAPQPTLETLQTGLGILATNDLRSDLNAIQCPFLHLVGEKDTIVPLSAAHYLAWLYPSMQLHILPGSGHAPFLPAAKPAVNLIQTFMNDRIINHENRPLL